MSRLIAQSRGRPRRQRRIFHVALALFLALGLVGSGVMLTFPRQLSGLLHNELAAPSIRVLAPALLILGRVGLTPKRIYIMSSDGSYKEVLL